MTELIEQLDRLIIGGETLSTNLREALTDATLERTIDGVTVLQLEVHDPAKKLISSQLFKERTVVTGDGKFELAQIKKQGEKYTITFEDSIVAALRQQTDARTAAAGTTTRAQFIRRLVEEVGGTVVGPDSPEALGEDVSTVSGSAATSPPASAVDPANPPADQPGIDSTFGGLIPPEAPSPSTTQYLTAAQIAAVAANAGFAGDALVVAVAVSLAESHPPGNSEVGDPNAHNTKPPDNSYGLWQINMLGRLGPARRAQFGLASNDELYDPNTNARAAFEISGGGSNFGPWTTYGNGHGSYLNYMTTARNGVAARADAPSSDPVQATDGISTAAQGNSKPEDWWTSIKRLADEVQWRVFADLNVIHFAPDGWLIAQQAQFTLNERSDGVDLIDFDFDVGKPVATATIEGRAQLWQIPPGVVVAIDELGVADGSWIAATIHASLLQPQVSVDLTKPKPALPEPALQAAPTDPTSTTADFPVEHGSWDLYVNKAEKMVQYALSKEGGPYKWGGNGPTAFDCSGLCAAAANAAGAHLERNTTLAWNQCQDAGTVIDIQDGINTRGAILWQLPNRWPFSDHMAISLGNGKVIEALNPRVGIRQGDAFRFHVAALVPDLAG